MMASYEPPDAPLEPSEEERTVFCRDCGNYEECPCGEHGWCLPYGEFVDREEAMTIPRDCEEYAE